MSREYAVPLRLDLQPSILLQRYLLLLHLFALVPIFIAHLAVPIKISLLMFLLASYIFEYKKSLINASLLWHKENNWQYKNNTGIWFRAELTPMSFAISWLVILVLKLEPGCYKVVLVPIDALDDESFRRLKVRLRLLKLATLKAA